jgi:putative addiction module component (TIGR02574 family)
MRRDQQIHLAMELWKAIEVRDDDATISDEQRAELDRRIAEADANPKPSEDWNALREKLLRGEI